MWPVLIEFRPTSSEGSWRKEEEEDRIAVKPKYCNLSVCDCLSASVSLEPLELSSRNLLCRFPVAVARSSSGGVAALRYVMYFRVYV